MEFSPKNAIVKLCLQGMAMVDKGNPEIGYDLFLQAWQEATEKFEKFIAAHCLARYQDKVIDKLDWLEASLQIALEMNDDTTRSALSALYSTIAECHKSLDDIEQANIYVALSDASKTNPTDKGPFYHGTKADLANGELLNPGGLSNYKTDLKMNHIYFTAQVHGAGLAAELANGENPPRVYIVEPTGRFEDDPNVTNKKFPGNPTRSYRSEAPLKIVGEVAEWERLTPDALQAWRDKLAKNTGEIIN